MDNVCPGDHGRRKIDGCSVLVGKGLLRRLSSGRRLFSARRLVSAWVWGLFILMTACAGVDSGEKSVAEDATEQWGIEITSVRTTAGGHMIDFRYRVLDANKAGTLFARENKPHMIDEASRKILTVPITAKIGPLRTSGDIKEGSIYWIFFGNPDGLVKAGSKVTVVIGDFRAENLVVQ